MKKYSVADAADPYVSYDMIHAHTELPSYSEPRLQLLYAVLAQSKETRERSELFSLVTALVQLGMDTHDLVDTETGQRTETQMRSRQLKILAGDYFSARFYQLLAVKGEIELVAILSKAVADVNRLKISFYSTAQSATLTAEQYLMNRISLKSEMFAPFHKFLSKPIAKVWKELLQQVTAFEVMLDELSNIFDAGGYARSFAYWNLHNIVTSVEEKKMLQQNSYNLLVDKYHIRRHMLDYLHTAYEAVLRILDTEQLAELKAELSHTVENMKKQLGNFSMKEVEAQ
ncbi:MAG: heptaprenyl diphosphate synthase component 1 [Candidatus Pristimantibacillus lignocellulolyticus]|uniref:Heptaprenyl diphosphate synthase component 1 n=1 Tax=Candidatus Pristimantibacillus lignocellulolyticus TaxID=2994561 RepID=A0A9J6ZE97_9BACL|nr:MAG: heptaprenyl diphosphate synthase component 1 [Candidatus Pristimantibacillus lignocellulolyticus]